MDQVISKKLQDGQTTNPDGSVTSAAQNYAQAEKNKIASKEAKLAERSENVGLGGVQLYGDRKERGAALSAAELAKLGYGQGLDAVGEDIQRIRDLQRGRTEQVGGDPVSAAIMGQKASQMANAQRNLAASGIKGGVAAGAIADVGRKADSDIAASLYGQQRQSIADERSLASNMLSGTMGSIQGGKAEGTQAPGGPQASSWTDSVICTELHRQGIMSLDLYKKDAAFGEMLKKECPEVVVGYHVIAKPIVKLMQKSKLATKIISVPAMKWARHIANEENSFIGYATLSVGMPFCSIIGKIKLLGVKYVPFCRN